MCVAKAEDSCPLQCSNVTVGHTTFVNETECPVFPELTVSNKRNVTNMEKLVVTCHATEPTVSNIKITCYADAFLEGMLVVARVTDNCGRKFDIELTSQARSCQASFIVARPAACNVSAAATTLAASTKIDAAVNVSVHQTGGLYLLDAYPHGMVAIPRRETSTIPLQMKWKLDISNMFDSSIVVVPPPFVALINHGHFQGVHSFSVAYSIPTPQLKATVNGTELPWTQPTCYDDGYCTRETTVSSCGPLLVAINAVQACDDDSEELCDVDNPAALHSWEQVVNVECAREPTVVAGSLRAQASFDAVATIGRSIVGEVALTDEAGNEAPSKLVSLAVHVHAAVPQGANITESTTKDRSSHVLVREGKVTPAGLAFGLQGGTTFEHRLRHPVNLTIPVDPFYFQMKLGEQQLVSVEGTLYLADEEARRLQGTPQLTPHFQLLVKRTHTGELVVATQQQANDEAGLEAWHVAILACGVALVGSVVVGLCVVKSFGLHRRPQTVHGRGMAYSKTVVNVGQPPVPGLEV